jgi:superfamily I DNA/RNA helicase
MSFDWSDYQKRIFDWGINGSGNAVVDAKAGSGKTTTLIELARRIKEERGEGGVFVAFNKHIERELSDKLSGTDFIAKTVHSCGFGAIRYAGYDVDVNSDKIKDIVNTVTSDMAFKKNKKTAKANLRNIVDLVRLNLADPSDESEVLEVARHHGISIEEIFPLIETVINRSNRVAKENGEIDFTDMIYLPVKWGLSMYQNKWVFVDEAQDLNTCTRRVIDKMLRRDGRAIFVGDPRQAIYGFAGADSDSFEQIKEEFDTTELPLNITYRCPKSHVENAQRIVPEIEPRENAPEGEIIEGKMDSLPGVAESGDYILCRTNAPLIRNCIRLIKNGQPAHVVGRNIKRGLLQIANRIDFNNFNESIRSYYQRKREKLLDSDASEEKLRAFRDKVDAIEAVYGEYDVSTGRDLKSKIKSLFKETSDSVKLMTAHKAKGLENDRIIIIRTDLMPLRWKGQKKWEIEQEMNLKYTAETRSTDTLIFLHPEN